MFTNVNPCYKQNRYMYQCPKENSFYLNLKNNITFQISYNLRYYFNGQYYTFNSLIICPNQQSTAQIPVTATHINFTVFDRKIPGDIMPIICNKFYQSARNISIIVTRVGSNIVCNEVSSLRCNTINRNINYRKKTCNYRYNDNSRYIYKKSEECSTDLKSSSSKEDSKFVSPSYWYYCD